MHEYKIDTFFKHIAVTKNKMGNYSYLITTNEAAKQCNVRWEDVNPLKLTGRASYIKDMYDAEDESQPDTISQIAEMLDSTKIFGYLTNDFIEALQEISKCCVFEAEDTTANKPRIYYEVEDFEHLSYLEFHPGNSKIVVGTYDLSKDEDYFLPDVPDDSDADSDDWIEYWENRKFSKNVMFTKIIEAGQGWRRETLETVEEEDYQKVIDTFDSTEDAIRFMNAAKAAGSSLKVLMEASKASVGSLNELMEASKTVESPTNDLTEALKKVESSLIGFMDNSPQYYRDGTE